MYTFNTNYQILVHKQFMYRYKTILVPAIYIDTISSIIQSCTNYTLIPEDTNLVTINFHLCTIPLYYYTDDTIHRKFTNVYDYYVLPRTYDYAHGNDKTMPCNEESLIYPICLCWYMPYTTFTWYYPVRLEGISQYIEHMLSFTDIVNTSYCIVMTHISELSIIDSIGINTKYNEIYRPKHSLNAAYCLDTKNINAFILVVLLSVIYYYRNTDRSKVRQLIQKAYKELCNKELRNMHNYTPANIPVRFVVDK